MRAASIHLNNVKVGVLTEENSIYRFQYDGLYVDQSESKPISLTLPLQKEPFTSAKLFPFFCGLIAEGINKQIQCRLLKVDENDHFGLLLKTGDKDTIGAVSVKPKTSKP